MYIQTLEKEALKTFAEAYRLNPSNKDILQHLQQLSISVSSPSSDLDSNYPFQECLTLSHQWLVEKAEECFITYLNLNPQESSALYEYGLLVYYTGGRKKMNKSKLLFEQAFHTSIDNKNSNNKNKNKNKKEEENRNTAKYGTIACMMDLELGFDTKAEICLEQIAKEFEYVDAYRHLGKLRAGMGRTSEAQIAHDMADRLERRLQHSI
mmetsp:Transcript_41234/g.53199  ORF Transcript_41234/g.53199 Transcript_41234/m.53199 type:complete len:209 (+) Transcript_41234:3-629(+)